MAPTSQPLRVAGPCFDARGLRGHESTGAEVGWSPRGCALVRRSMRGVRSAPPLGARRMVAEARRTDGREPSPPGRPAIAIICDIKPSPARHLIGPHHASLSTLHWRSVAPIAQSVMARPSPRQPSASTPLACVRGTPVWPEVQSDRRPNGMATVLLMHHDHRGQEACRDRAPG